jgi:hypothetical protein
MVGKVLAKEQSMQARGGVGVTSNPKDVLQALLQQGVIIPCPLEVQEYLDRYSELCDILPAASKNVRDRFDENVQLSLELYRDPEIEDDYLTLYVRQEHYDSDILTELNSISASFDGQLRLTPGWFLITTDFQPPR